MKDWGSHIRNLPLPFPWMLLPRVGERLRNVVASSIKVLRSLAPFSILLSYTSRSTRTDWKQFGVPRGTKSRLGT